MLKTEYQNLKQGREMRRCRHTDKGKIIKGIYDKCIVTSVLSEETQNHLL
jgi:hypothetical protein